MNPSHFTFAEMTRTSTGLDNTPDWASITHLKAVALFLDSVREEFGKPIRVNCAFRSEAVNAAVGGVKTSAHLSGLAADICAYSGKETDNRALLSILERRIKEIDQLISYHKAAGDKSSMIRFIHVGLSKSPRCQRLCK